MLVVNHEKRLDVDTACSNLAIKYNMIYLSVYQLIKQHITECTALGKELVASRRSRPIVKHDDSVQDEFQESEFSAVHFSSSVVLKVIKQTIQAQAGGQKFVLLEGMFNTNKLEDRNDQLALRAMDEFFMVEKEIGEVAAICNLTFKKDDIYYNIDRWEEFDQPAAAE